MARSRHDKDKEKNRFYLLPGQGGRAHRSKQWRVLKWSLLTALIVAGIMAAALYWLNNHQSP
jgi:hypothetical protein